MKLIILFLLLLSSLLANEKLENVSLQLKWKYQFQFAGFIAAKEKGFYKDVGLDVQLLEFDSQQNVMEDLNEGKITFAISDSSLIYEAMQGKPVLAMMAIFQESPYILMSLPSSKIYSLDDINNSSVAFFRNINGRFIEAMLKSSDLSYTIVSVDNKLNRLINKEVDLISGYLSNEPYVLKERGLNPTVFNPKDYGYAGYGDILFTHKKLLETNPLLIKKMYEASRKGWEYAFAHKEEIAELIYEKYNSSHKSKEALLYEAEVLQKISAIDENFGELNKEKIRSVSNLFTFIIEGKYDIRTLDTFIYKYDKNSLSFEERSYVDKNPKITFTGDPNWLPFEAFTSEGEYIGIVAEHLSHIEESINVRFDKKVSESWSDALEIAMSGQADVISGDAADKILNQKFRPIDAYIKNPIVVIKKDTHAYVDSLSEISHNKIAIIKDYGYTADIYKYYPNMNFVEVENIQEGLRSVSSGENDAMLASLALASYSISKMKLDDLSIVGKTNIVMNVTLFVNKDKPLLHSILNKATQTLDTYDHQEILSKWRNITTVTKVDYSMLWKLILIILAILLFFFFRQRTLLRYNEELEKQKELYSVVFENSSNGILIIDVESGTFVKCNQKVVDILEYKSKEDVLNLRPSELSPEFQPDGRRSDEKSTEMIGLAISKGVHTFEWKHLRAAGKEFWAEIVLTSIVLDNKKVIHVIWKDIDEKKKNELQLVQHAQILKQVHDSIISTDLEGYILSWNHGSQILLDYTAEEMIGKHITEIYPPDSYGELEEIINMLKKKSMHHAVVRLLKKSKETIVADLSLSMLKDKIGKDIGMIGYSQDITKQKEAQEELLKQKTVLDHQAHYDMLTQLPNRLLFNDRLHQGTQKAKRNKSELALLFIDLDHFKEINDSLGHDVGDKVLQVVTDRLSTHIRKGDTLSRLGGDEFTVIMDGLSRSEDAALLAQKILDVLIQPVLIDNHELYVSSSIGISLYPKDSTDITNLLKYADAAMYRAKDEGRNNYQFYSAEMTERAFERIVMETSLRQALKEEEFVVYYQPQVDVVNKKIIGLEALIRWNHPTMGLVPPVKFIPLAEETGLIVELDQWVMKTAMKQVKQWHEWGLFSGDLALNLAIKDLEHSEVVNTLQARLKEYDFNPNCLVLEVTEGEVMKKPDEAIIKLQQINDLGVSIAIDDFGTGYSSLSYLKRLPISKLKIDQSFVRDIPGDEEDSAIVKAIIALANSLNLDLLAEGVETQEQNDFLAENGCTNIQGYLYARPMPSEEIESFIKSYENT